VAKKRGAKRPPPPYTDAELYAILGEEPPAPSAAADEDAGFGLKRKGTKKHKS